MKRLVVTCAIEERAQLVAGSDLETKTPISRVFAETLIAKIDARGKTTSSSVWHYALRLFGDFESLCKRIETLVGALEQQGDEDLQPYLAKTIRTYLEDARRELHPASSSRLKVWERINMICSELSRTGFQLDHKHPEFLPTVLEEIVVRFPADKNLPRNTETLENYFREFSPHFESLNEEDLLILMAEAPLQDEDSVDPLVALEQCLDALKSYDATLYTQLSVKFKLSDIGPTDAATFRNRTGISRRQYEKNLVQAQSMIKECVEDKIDAE